MVDVAFALQWMSIALMFLFGSIWSEENARYGYVVTAFMAGFFWMIGWIQFAYLGTVIPIVFMIAILSYLRGQAKHKMGLFGSQGGVMWKIMSFIIFIQFAIIIINGAAVFQNQYTSDPSNEFTSYTLESTKTVFQPFTTGISGVDMVTAALTYGWMLINLVWSMVFSFINIYGTMVNIFHVPKLIAGAIAAGIYILTALELTMMIFKPFRVMEI